MPAASEKSVDKVLSPKALCHVVFQTPNFKAMVAFYKAFLGAHATFENDALAFLTYDEEHHRIAIAGIPGITPRVPMAAGLAHTAFGYENLRDLTTAYSQRKARGILPIFCTNHGPTTSIYYQDPDGNQLETQVDNFETPEEASEMMAGTEYAENPIGVDFEPEAMIRKLDAGEDEQVLMKRANIGPRSFDTIPVPPKPDVRESYELVHQSRNVGGF